MSQPKMTTVVISSLMAYSTYREQQQGKLGHQLPCGWRTSVSRRKKSRKKVSGVSWQGIGLWMVLVAVGSQSWRHGICETDVGVWLSKAPPVCYQQPADTRQ